MREDRERRGKILLLIVMSILLSFSVYSIDETDLVAYYQKNNTDIHNGYDLVVGLGIPVYSEDGIYCENDYFYNTDVLNSVSGEITFMYFFNSSNQEVYNQRILGFTSVGVDDFLVSWIRRSSDVAGKKNEIYYSIREETTNNEFYDVSGEIAGDKIKHFFALSVNNNTNEALGFFDGSFVSNNSVSMTLDDLNSDFGICDIDNSTNYFTGYIKEIVIFNRSLTRDEIEEIYTNSSWYSGSTSPPVSQGSLTINHNLQNTSTNISTGLYLTYNGSVSDTTNIFNCTLYNDTNIIETQLDKDLSLNQSFFINTLETEENYVFKIYCIQAGEVNDTTTSHFYQIDSKIPSLAFTTTFVNNSNHIKDATLSIGYTFTDTNIYAVNVSWLDAENTLQQNFFIDNLTGSSYSNTTSKILSDTCNNCSIVFEAWDSHTGEVLKYDLQTIDDFTFRYNNIIITSDKKLKFDKKKDKYSFIVDKKSTICYTTDNYFRKVQSEYNSHYIDFENQIWIDELEYNFTEYYENGKLNKLCFYNDKDKEYKTESIGDLNYARYGYHYNIISQDTLYLSEISTNTANIYEVLNMLPLILIYITFMIYGYWLVKTGNYQYGFFMLLMTIGFDLYLVQYFYGSLVLNNGLTGWRQGFTGLFSAFLIIWILVKGTMPFLMKKTTYVKR